MLLGDRSMSSPKEIMREIDDCYDQLKNTNDEDRKNEILLLIPKLRKRLYNKFRHTRWWLKQ